jgi:hypothetical protein
MAFAVPGNWKKNVSAISLITAYFKPRWALDFQTEKLAA